MYYYIYIEDEKINGCGTCPSLNSETTNFEVPKTVYEKVVENQEKYIWDGSNIVINPNYEQEQAQKEAQRKIEELKLKLEELDKQRIRALCEPSNRTDDQTWLEYYNEQIVNIRKELQSLQN